MKIKSKLILATTSLLVLSGVAAGTSTFAWFTANQSASAQLTAISVNSDQDQLTIESNITDAELVDTDITIDPDNGTNDYSQSFVGVTHLTDVSGNGINFFKGYLSADSTQASQTIASSSALNEGTTPITHPYCFEFTTKFTSSNANHDMAIFLSKNSTIEGVSESAADVSIANGARVAVLDPTEKSLLAYYAPNDDTFSNPYIFADGSIANGDILTQEVTADNLGLTTGNILSTTDYASNLLTSAYKSTIDYNENTSTTTEAAGSAGYIGRIVDNGELNVVIRVWLEGTDSDMSNSALTGFFNTNLVFNGVTVNA